MRPGPDMALTPVVAGAAVNPHIPVDPNASSRCL
jgi:hypothetical protein